MTERLRISVEGIVQGVGFRPFVYRLATELGLAGWVNNTSDGVVIEVEGGRSGLEVFLSRLEKDPPPLAGITSIRSEKADTVGYEGFSIRRSLAGADPGVLISPDTATCGDCLKELFDREDRRYRYPFINCTNCGPRYTIMRKVPYDRPNTSMNTFTMCRLCQTEYEDPGDRRFHAQPNACPDCGPALKLVLKDGSSFKADALEKAVDCLEKGQIVAIKGLGGFHLAVDPLFSGAVERLREKKGREEKPFALMVRDLETAGKFSFLAGHAKEILSSTESPIALLRRRESPEIQLSPAVAPRSRYYGLMLPYTPLHHLLMAHFGLLVMTSANLSEEPLCASNEEAFLRLGDIADAWLTHDREIVLRCDDSIVRLDPVRPENGPVVLRRARGFVPSPVELPVDGQPVLALGPELKGTVCLTRGSRAFIGQHLGDLKNLETMDFLKEVVSHLMDILEVRPTMVVRDLHPDYLTTRLTEPGEEVPWPAGLPVHAVQHHHAHILSCQAEAGLTGPCVGIALDGTGYGTDGTIWGGEILYVDGTFMERKGHLKPVWMPGGEKAIEEPWRMAVSCLTHTTGLNDLHPGILSGIPEEDVSLMGKLCADETHGIATSSAGRLFDAFSALLGICSHSRYEGQAAIELEAAAYTEELSSLPYNLDEDNGRVVIDMLPAFAFAVGLLEAGSTGNANLKMETVKRIAGQFHRALAEAFADAVSRIFQGLSGVEPVVPLGGGVFQNELFCVMIARELEGRGLKPLFHSRVPTNDGGISLGQAVYGLLKQKER